MPKVVQDEKALEIKGEKSLLQPLPAMLAQGGARVCSAESVNAATSPTPFSPRPLARRFAALAEAELAHGRAFIFAPVFLGAGAALWFSLSRDPDPVVCRMIFLIGLVMAVVMRNMNRTVSLAAAAMALAGAGMWLAQAQTARMATVMADAPVTVNITGRVVSREAVAGGGWRYIVDVLSTARPELGRPPLRVALVARSGHAVLADGEGIAGRARLSPPSGPAMPGLADFAFTSYFQGIGAIGFFYGSPMAATIPQKAQGHVDRMNAVISHLRGVIGERIRSIVPGDAGAFATAMVTDERRAMTRKTAEALRLSGLAHIIAISGLNMALAAGIFFVGLRMLFSLHQGFAQAFPIKKLAAAGALVGVTAYYLLSGSAVSAQRAWLMMSIMLIAVLIGRPSISMRNVALSALVIIILSPSDVMGASFQMSFAATAALVAGYSLHRDRKTSSIRPSVLPGVALAVGLGRFFWGVALTSIIGGVSTAIFSMAHFQQLAMWGLPANLAAMPIVSFVVMPAGLVAMLLMPFGLDEWPLRIMGYGLDLVIRIATEVAGWSGEGASGMLPPYVFPLVVTGFLLLTLLKTRLRLAGAALIFATILATLVIPVRMPPSMIVAETGELVGLVHEGAIATNRERPPSFVFSQWKRALKLADHLKPNVLESVLPKQEGARSLRRELTDEEEKNVRDAMRSILLSAEPGRFSCDGKAWCAARHANGARIITIGEAAFLAAACASADIVVTPVRLRYTLCSRPEGEEASRAAHLISGRNLARNGSIAIRFGKGGVEDLSLETARNGNMRAWNMHRLYDWRSRRFVRDEEEAAPVSEN